MEMTKRMETAGRALNKLHEGVEKKELTEIERDGLIQRFEFCFEIMWKCGKDYLFDRDGLAVASPKKVIRALCEVGVLSDAETEKALQMVDDVLTKKNSVVLRYFMLARSSKNIFSRIK